MTAEGHHAVQRHGAEELEASERCVRPLKATERPAAHGASSGSAVHTNQCDHDKAQSQSQIIQEKLQRPRSYFSGALGS